MQLVEPRGADDPLAICRSASGRSHPQSSFLVLPRSRRAAPRLSRGSPQARRRWRHRPRQRFEFYKGLGFSLQAGSAVAGLDENGAKARRVVYDHAGTVLVRQLRELNTGLSIGLHELEALDEAIRKVELEVARPGDPRNNAMSLSDEK